VYIDILKALYDGEIGQYRGDALLSSWLIVTARNRSLDFFRKRYGRLHTPTGYEKLSEFDKQVLRLYFVSKLPFEIVVNVLGWKGLSTDVDDIVESIQRIENTMDRRYLDRLDAEHQARKCQIDSFRLLKYLLHMRMEFEEKMTDNRADYLLLETEILDKTTRLRAALSGLTDGERRVVSLRFEQGHSARVIAEKLRLKNQRQAYWLIEKVVNKLRKAMLTRGS